MARSPSGRQLTEQHRRSQLGLRAATARDVVRVWPAFDVDDIDGSWPAVEASLVTLVGARRSDSASLATNYFQKFRTAEGVPGVADSLAVVDQDRKLLVATLRLLGPIQAKKNIAARVSDVTGRTLSRLVGTVSKQVLDGGRQTLAEAIKSDPRGQGWRRITDGDPCDFCADLAAAGIHSEGGGFPAHDHCGCTAEPAFG